MKRYLVIQTAYIGDAILTLPLIQALKKVEVETSIDVLVIPRTSGLFSNHPAVSEVLIFDKSGRDRGFNGFRRVSRLIVQHRYEAALVPHRSIRSALLPWLSRIGTRIGFDRSAGWFLLTQTVRYEQSLHEIDRNLSLLEPLGVHLDGKILPDLYPSEEDIQTVDAFLAQSNLSDPSSLIGIAPGSVWNTKRWLKERYAELARRLVEQGFSIALVGGEQDRRLCQEIEGGAASSRIAVAAGQLSLLQSAELIRRCKAFVSNDSAPLHLATAMRTPVVAIFGSTVPEFGFAPYGDKSVVIETKGLSCRPCSAHGRQRCPIKTFECMENISTEQVFNKVQEMLS
jgi:heptosyltransferase-2